MCNSNNTVPFGPDFIFCLTLYFPASLLVELTQKTKKVMVFFHAAYDIEEFVEKKNFPTLH